MAIGIKLPGWVLNQNQDWLVLDVSAVEESVASGVTQRTYADGQQRSISGFATRSAVGLTVEELSATDLEWLRERSGQLVTLRDTRGGRWDVIIGDSALTTNPSLSETVSYGVSLQLFYARERN